MPDQNNNKKFVPLSLFIPLFVLIFTVLGLIGTMVSSKINGQDEKIEKVRDNVSSIEGDVKSIRSDIGGINTKLEMLSNYFKLVPKDIK